MSPLSHLSVLVLVVTLVVLHVSIIPSSNGVGMVVAQWWPPASEVAVSSSSSQCTPVGSYCDINVAGGNCCSAVNGVLCKDSKCCSPGSVSYICTYDIECCDKLTCNYGHCCAPLHDVCQYTVDCCNNNKGVVCVDGYCKPGP